MSQKGAEDTPWPEYRVNWSTRSYDPWEGSL